MTALKLKKEHTDMDRLRGIVRTLRECDQAVTDGAVIQQFRRETGRPPAFHDVKRALRRETP